MPAFEPVTKAAFSDPPLFREVQRFNQVWLWALILSLATLFWFAAFRQLVQGTPWGDRPAPDGLLFSIWLVVGVGIPLLFLTVRLITEVRPDGICVRFVPFHSRFRRFALSDLAHFEARTYRPILEYGGWGIRWGLRGEAYNISGNRGVQLTFKNGKRLLIGSQSADELCRAIAQAARAVVGPGH